MERPDVIRITYEQNPAMREACAQSKPGDKGKGELHFTYKAMDPEGCDLIVEALVPEGYEVVEEPKAPPIAPMGTPATMTPTALQVEKKSGY